MDIEEARLKYVGKLCMFAYGSRCVTGDIGIVTAIEKRASDPNHFYARFTRLNGDTDRYYFSHTPTSRRQWHIHVYDEPCPVPGVPS